LNQSIYFRSLINDYQIINDLNVDRFSIVNHMDLQDGLFGLSEKLIILIQVINLNN
jgi:hypothetical protein